MSNYEEENEVCECIVCEMVEEFRELVKDEVDWESALRHVLHLTITKSESVDDEMISELVDEVYMDGFTDGLEAGVDKAHSLMLALVEDTDERIAEFRNGELDEDIEDEADNDGIEDLTDEQFIDIQKIISKDL